MASEASRVRVQIENGGLPERSYDVVVGEGTLDGIVGIVRSLCPIAKKVMVGVDSGLGADVIDGVVERLRAEGGKEGKAGGREGGGPLSVSVVRLEATERRKTQAATDEVVRALTDARLERTDCVVGLGGGIVGDVMGYAAGTYRRGVGYVGCPTTLLAMVDASVGGKTGVNIVDSSGRMRKNMVGVFAQPRGVVADTRMLRTLSVRHVRCGMAECVKHALVAGEYGDEGLLEATEAAAEKAVSLEPRALRELIVRSVSLKAKVVGRDEWELGGDDGRGSGMPGIRGSSTGAGARGKSGAGRAVLNLGHTFGHAIETMEHLSPDGTAASAPLQHGEAVSLGLCAACELGKRLGMLDAETAERVVRLLERIGLPTRVAGLPGSGEVMEAMAHDKKAASGRMRLVVPTSERKCVIVEDPEPGFVAAAIDSIRA